MSDILTRVCATVALGVGWFVVVVPGSTLGGPGNVGVFAIVAALSVAPMLGMWLLARAVEDAGGGPAAILWIAWILAGILGFLTIIGAGGTYESWYGRPQAVIVMDTRCSPNSETNGCDPEVRLSTTDAERDLGWLGDCAPLHARGQRATVLVDPRGWFRSELSTCAGVDGWLGWIAVGSVCYVPVLTLAQVAWVVTSRRVRRVCRVWT